MNYYILPKTNTDFSLNIVTQSTEIQPHISHSLAFFINDLTNQVNQLSNSVDLSNNEEAVAFFSQLVNTYEFIFSNVPGSNFSVSKVKPDSNIFYELMEIFSICGISNSLSPNPLNILHLFCNQSQNNVQSINYLIDVLREDIQGSDVITDLCLDETNSVSNFDLGIFEISSNEKDIDNYVCKFIKMLLFICRSQTYNGCSIIKIKHIYHKPLLDCIYMLCSLFDKVYICKPSVSNITTEERFIVLKKFIGQDSVKLTHLIFQLNYILNHVKQNVSSLVQNIPYYFINKIEESNAIIGQQLLDALNQIINIYKNKLKEEKIEVLKNNHIQKSIQWCEKYNLPHNKFTEHTNIFLNTIPRKCKEI